MSKIPYDDLDRDCTSMAAELKIMHEELDEARKLVMCAGLEQIKLQETLDQSRDLMTKHKERADEAEDALRKISSFCDIHDCRTSSHKVKDDLCRRCRIIRKVLTKGK